MPKLEEATYYTVFFSYFRKGGFILIWLQYCQLNLFIKNYTKEAKIC